MNTAHSFFFLVFEIQFLILNSGGPQLAQSPNARLQKTLAKENFPHTILNFKLKLENSFDDKNSLKNNLQCLLVSQYLISMAY